MDNQDGMEDDDALSSISLDARLAFTLDMNELSEELVNGDVSDPQYLMIMDLFSQWNWQT